VIAVNLSKPDVPAPVLGEFQDVKRAEQDKETAESVAEGYRNDIIPRAKGEAVQMVQKAEAYKSQVVAEAQGDVARFNSIYQQYVNAKDVTRKRIYLETMEAVMKGMPKVIIDEAGKGNGVVPVLPLPPLPQAAAKPASSGGQ
jgi:membrane protease subunit HflK